MKTVAFLFMVISSLFSTNPESGSVLPQFPGGQEAIATYISAAINYPQKAVNETIEGEVMVQLQIDEQGAITNAKIVQGIGYGCDEEALRVIRKMPNWSPAKQAGRAVPCKVKLKVRFSLVP